MTNPPPLFSALADLGERQGKTEAAAAELLNAAIRGAGLTATVQTFPVTLPRQRSARLTVDGRELPCVATSFASGEIIGKENIISSALPMAVSPDLPNINVNPYCPAISRGNHYRKPAVAVSHETLALLLAGSHVRADIDVELVKAEAHNLLVGNLSSPRAIVFTHFDSVGPGANDNLSGTLSTLQTLLDHPELTETVLFVFSGAEELSTDLPYYWGAGYRRFQEQYPAAMESAKQLLVIDSVGKGTPGWITDPGVVRRAFPLNDMDHFTAKTALLAAPLERLMPVYHSELDLPDAMDMANIEVAAASLAEKLL